jgi:hypothetical protein
VLHKKTFKVLALIPKKDGGTYWMRVGTAYLNKDESINAFVDAFPREGKLQLRELDEEDLRERDSRRGPPSAPAGAGSAQASLSADAVPF